MDFIKTFTITKEPGSMVKIEGEIPVAALEAERKAALESLGKNIELDGFRKGHVPAAMLEKHIGEMAILGEMAERAIAKAYPAVVIAEKIAVVGHPKIAITKIAPGNPLSFTATVAVLPEITLPDYKAIAVSENKTIEGVTVTDEMVENEIMMIKRQRLAYERLQAKAAAGARPENSTDLPTPETVEHVHDENCDHDHDDHDHHHHDHEEELDTAGIIDTELPELTDEYVAKLGQPGQFTTVEDFKTKLREHLTIEKEREVTGKRRAAITDTIIAGATMELPEVMVEAEYAQMFNEMEAELSHNNLKIEDYLNHIKKSRDDLRAEWREPAEKRVKLQLVLAKIAETEGIKADENEVKENVDHLMSHYKDADESRVRAYVSSMLQNEAVMKKLEAEK